MIFNYIYKLPILPYIYQDLEPFIDTHTMALHYHGHEQAYLDNLNNIVDEDSVGFQLDLFSNVEQTAKERKVQEAVLNIKNKFGKMLY